MTERKYVLTKVAAGDYLLPSNDRLRIYRLAVYEDGPSHGLDTDKDRTYWGVWRWSRPMDGYLDVTDWNLWEMVESLLPSRKAAIEAALRFTA